MTRLRTLLALACLAFALGVAPAIAQESPPGGTPAVVVEEGAPVAAEPAWTFRFMVPAVLAISGLVLAIAVIGYGVRLRGRYRVVR
jgi:hypothetical protein